MMERVDGVSYDQAREEYGAAARRRSAAQLAIQGVLETTLIYGMFHGDLHAGNVLIDGGDRFSLVDFGICGRIDAEQRAALVSFMLAFAADGRRGHTRARSTQFGALPPDADLDALGGGAASRARPDRSPRPATASPTTRSARR